MKSIRVVISIIMTICIALGVLTIGTSVQANDASTAKVVGVNSSQTISFGDSKNYQDIQYAYFKFEVKSVGLVKIDVHLEDVSGGWLYYCDNPNIDNYFDSKSVSTNTNTKVGNYSKEKVFGPGTYYVIYKNSGNITKGGKLIHPGGSVKVSYSFTDYKVTTGIDKDDNDSIPNASTWDYKTTPSFTGAIVDIPRNRNDYYKINVNSDSHLHLRFEASSEYTLKIYDADGNQRGSYYAYWNKAYGRGIVDKDLHFTPGVWYLGVVSSIGGWYNVRLEDKAADNKSGNTSSNYKSEWVGGKYYDADGKQSYNGVLSWKSNSQGWWVQDSLGWYPTSSWQKIDGVWYYFKADGYMASNEYYYGYWFNSDGSWDSRYYLSWKSNASGWWVEDTSGWWPSNSWLKIDGCWYYFNGAGYMVTNQYVDGWWIGADGVCR